MIADINLFEYTAIHCQYPSIQHKLFYPNLVCHMFGTQNYYRQLFRVELGQPT
jgi:hypothetical protein